MFSQEFRISSNSKAGWWNQPIENPSGNKIVYEVFTETYNDFHNSNGWYRANIIVYDIVHGNTTATLTGYEASPHNGAEIKWIDDTHIAIFNSSTANIDIWDINNTATGPVSIFDNDLYGVCGGMYPMDYNENNGFLLTGQMQYGMVYGTNDITLGDVMLLNPFNGNARVVLDASAFVAWIQNMKDQLIRLNKDPNNYSWDPRDWMISHKYFSPDGNLIWIKLTVRDASRNNTFDFGFTFNLNGDISSIKFYDAWSRSHPTWWDNNRIYNDDGWIYNRDGTKYKKVVGYTTEENNNIYYTPTLHPGFSSCTQNYPQRKYVAGEDGNPNIPLTMQLFKSGILGPLAILFESSNTNLIWVNSKTNNHFHVNPSFSRDGKRIYYTRQVNSGTIGLYAYDIPEDVYYTGNGNTNLSGWDDVNISVHPSYSGWFFSDYTKYTTNVSKQAKLFKGPWHNVSKGYSFPMGVDANGNVYVAGNQRFYQLNAGWDDVNTTGHTDFYGWYYSDVSINYASGGNPNNRAKWGPWHNPNKGYSLPMVVDQNGNIYSVNGKSHYDDNISNDGWEEVPYSNGWLKSDITIYKPNGQTATYRNIGPWHNPDKGYCLPFGVDGAGKIYSATLSSSISGYSGWYRTNILVHTITNPQSETGYITTVKTNIGPWQNLSKGYSLPMAVDLNGNIYSVNNGNWSGWDDVNTAGHSQYYGWYHSGFTVYKSSGQTTYNKKGPWHNPGKGFSLPMSVDNEGNIYVVNGMSRFNRKEALVEVWPNTTYYSGQDWYFSDISVLVKGGGEWFYLNSGPWFNLEKGYSLPIIALGDINSGTPKVTSGHLEINNCPKEYKLYNSYPNPFNPKTKIQYDLPEDSKVSLTIYNIRGQKVRELINNFKPAGSYSIIFDGSNLASGVYFYHIQAGDFVQTKRMLLIK